LAKFHEFTQPAGPFKPRIDASIHAMALPFSFYFCHFRDNFQRCGQLPTRLTCQFNAQQVWEISKYLFFSFLF